MFCPASIKSLSSEAVEARLAYSTLTVGGHEVLLKLYARYGKQEHDEIKRGRKPKNAIVGQPSSQPLDISK